ncbi:MAG TPA: PAS domain S-box protein [Pyrinomonadaceae bacterium]|nr:PAS domain S-box protein [Pyrinomonadaceae bacterium]
MVTKDSAVESPTDDRFRAILEQSPLSIQIMSPDGRILRVNRAWEELWGVTLDQIEGYNILEDRQLVERGIMSYIRRAFAGESVEIPPICYDPEATIPNVTRHAEPRRWTKAVAYPIKDEQGRVREVVLMHEDITARVAAEEALRESEARYRALFETTLDGIMVVDGESGRYVDVNESLCRILKASREQLVGAHFSQYMLPEREADAQRAFRSLAETGVFEGDFPMRAADGSVVELEWSSRAHVLPGLHVCVARDVTARKQAEAALRESESRYQRAAESGRVGIWDLDLETNDLFLSPNLKALLGYADDELENNLDAWCALVHEEDKENTIAATRAHIEGRTPRYEVEVRRRHKDGRYLWFLAQGVALRDASGRALRLTGSDTDITARKQAEQSQRESEERYRSLLENANDIIYAHDLQGNYLSINRAGAEITGYTREEILGGLNISQVVAPEHLERAREMVRRKLEDPSPTVYEVDILTKDRRRLTLEVSTRISYTDGQPAAIEGVARDVTARKRAEAEKARLAALLESQRRHLQAMVGSVPGVVWEAWGEPDEATQRINFVSDYVETMLGYTVEDWLSTPNFWLSIVHPEDRERAAREAAAIFTSGKVGTSRFRWMRKDGRAVCVEAQSSVILEDTGRPVGMRGVTMDITERMRQEANEHFLAEASTALSSTLEYEKTLKTVARLAVPQFADWCAIDMADEAGTLRRLAVAHIDPAKIEWAHEVYERYPPDPSEPHGLYQVLRTGQSEFYPDIPDELLVAGARDEKHLELMRQIGFRSAMLVPLKIRERVLGVVTFVNTESSRHHTTEDLALAEDLARRAALAVENARLYRAERQTREAAERTSDRLARLQAVSTALSQALTPQQVATAVIEQGISSLNAHAGVVVLLDEAGTELEIVKTVGFPPAVVEGWRRFALEAPVPLADAVRERLPVLVESFADYAERYPMLGPLASVTGSSALVALPLTVKGHTRGAMGLSFPRAQAFDEDDRAYMLALAQQCAQALERARLYETEQRLRAEAETANRLKDEFLATVSHELRTPLTAIVGWSSMLRTGDFDAATTARAIETIQRNALAQTQIIEDLLDVSRIITGKVTLDARPIELGAIIETALDSVRPAATTKGITLKSETKQAERLAVVWGDTARLQQVMWNLLANAVKFTPGGGEVAVSLSRAGGHVRVAVADTGQGINRDFLPYVFDRFRQADGTITRQHGGLGLGLSIVRHLVELHGGTVSVESAGEGLGATFTIELPAADAERAGSATAEAQKLPASRAEMNAAVGRVPELANLRVLIVDDEADARLLLQTIMEQTGARVRAAASAAEALAAFKEFKPDILVSDIGMPQEDGYALLRRVRALSPEEGGRIPAIALTAYAQEHDRMRALLAGFQVHVAKPVNPPEFVAVVVGLAGVTSRK